MNKYIKTFVIILFNVFLVTLPSYSIDNDIVVNQKDTDVLVSKINYDDVIKKAQEHSYDLKIADFNILISKEGIRDAKSEYFPKLNASASTEYTKNFRDGRDTTVMSIGDSFINPYTRYQSVLGVALSYNLFDFGVRRNVLNAAKEDVKVKELELEEKFQDLTLNVTDTYAKALMTDMQIKNFQEMQTILEKNLEYSKRLYEARVISSMELKNANIALEDVKRQLNDLKQIKEESLNWLTFYTGEKYDVQNIKIAEFKSSKFDPFKQNDYTKSVTWKVHELMINKKEFELKAAQRLNYPKVTLYSRYYLYGSNKSNYAKSIDDIQPSNYSIGGSINMPLFDGFKNAANIQTKKLELQQLYVERDKAIAELTAKLSTMRSNIINLNSQLENDEVIQKNLNEKYNAANKLLSKRMISPMEVNNAKIEILKEQNEFIKNKVAISATEKGIEALTREYE